MMTGNRSDSMPKLFATVLTIWLSVSGLNAADKTLPDKYGEIAARLREAALHDDAGMARLEYLCDRIGNRLGGSKGLEQAVQWSAEEMRKVGLQNVQFIPVKVPHWVRGRESLQMLTPVERPLPLLGLGGSVATPKEGLTADAVVVESFEELEALGEQNIKGRIVIYNQPFKGYGQTVVYRSSGASRAAKLGAVAVLVRSITGRSLSTPHTGALRYESGVPQIPAAAIAPEHAALFGRLAKHRQPIRLTLSMEAKTLSPADSANIIGEIPGSEKPEEVVVLGGHIDSWDVGQGAQDDGSGVMAALAAVALIKQLGLTPRRTIRVAFWTNEENGLAGGNEYRDWLGSKVKDHVAAIEMDGGAETPLGFGVGIGGRTPPGASANKGPEISEGAMKKLEEVGAILNIVGAGKMTRGGGGADIGPIMALGVPGFGLRTTGEHYNDWHHTEADTFDKVNAEDFRKNVAALAILSYVLADIPERLTEIP
jgi:hypothetical protein